MGRVYRSNEILLNSLAYPIKGLVRPSLVSTFPQKMVVGDFTKDDEVVASTWIISDQRGGCLIEEMEENIHADRFYWSTCNTDYKGHIVLPPLATEITLPTTVAPTITDASFEAWDNSTLTSWTEDLAGDGTLAKESTTVRTGDYAAKLDGKDSGSDKAEIYQDLATTQIQGRRFTATVYVRKETSGAVAKIGINDGNGTTWSDSGGSTGSFTAVSVTKTLAQDASRLRIICASHGDTSVLKWAIFDDISIARNDYGYPVVARDFNSETYWGFSGGLVGKLKSSTGDEIEGVYEFANPVLDMVVSLGVLFVLFGAEAGDDRLAEDLDDSELGIDVDDDADFAVGDYIKVDDEVMGDITDLTTNTITVTARGAWGTTAATHSENARVLEARQSYYMDVDEVFTLCNVVNAELGIDWDDKFFFLDKLSQLAYMTTPSGDSTASGKVKNLADSAVKSLFIYRDASANPIIYAGTRVGLFAHDYTNAKFIQTELSLPDHPTCGAGAAWWRDACYLSAGLNVYEYIAGSIAYIASMGLDSEDGLPTKYVGEIAKFTEGYDNFFALIDASITSGTGYSSVFVYNGRAWRCKWVDGTADQAMHCAIISSEFAYRFWWGVGDKIYYIPLERSLRNPLKVSTSTYGLSSVHITSVFDAGAAWDKRAIRLKALCDKMDAGNEEIVVKYRINEKCYEGIDAANTWTTLDTLDTDGETSMAFASSAGLMFKQIQFRFDLSRGSTTTKTPDLQRVTLVYERTIPAAWGWDIVLDFTKSYGTRTPEQMWQDLKALVGGVLVPFIFTHEDGTEETNYVEIRTLAGEATTGKEKLGTYQLRLVAP